MENPVERLQRDESTENTSDILTILHWHAIIDRMDVKFVLGSTPVELVRVLLRIVPDLSFWKVDCQTSTQRYMLSGFHYAG